MKKNLRPQEEIAELHFSDVPQLYSRVKYFDGNIAFADSLTFIPDLKKQFRVTFVAFVFCLEGSLTVKLNGIPRTIHKREALFVETNTVVSDVEHPHDFECKIIAVANNVGINFINNTIFEAVMQISNDPIIRFSQEEIDLMLKYYDLACYKLEHQQVNYGHETLMLLLRSFALDLLSSVNKHVTGKGNMMLRQGDKIYHRFLLMLAGNVTNERSVQYFASQLCVSPKYLSSICSERTGLTAGDLIANSMIARIRQMLQYSDKSIKEIASELKFSNLSFFGKYVKRHLGESPNNFRKRHNYGK